MNTLWIIVTIMAAFTCGRISKRRSVQYVPVRVVHQFPRMRPDLQDLRERRLRQVQGGES